MLVYKEVDGIFPSVFRYTSTQTGTAYIEPVESQKSTRTGKKEILY